MLRELIRTAFRGRRQRQLGSAPSQPSISVLIPAYNHEEFVAETVASIWETKYPHLEIVAVDDCSKDGTLDVLKGLKTHSPVAMQVTRNESNQGAAITLNRAAACSQGELLVCFSSDDLLTPDRFQRQVPLLASDNAVQVVFGNGRWFDKDAATSGIAEPKEVTDLLSRSPSEIYRRLITDASPIFLHTALIRRRFFNLVGGFDEAMIADDWVLNIRMFKYLAEHPELHHRFQNDIVFHYRSHGAQVWRDSKRQLASRWQVLERYTPAELQVEASNNMILGVRNSPNADAANPDSTATLLRVARLHAQRGSTESAVRLCQQVLRQQPTNTEARTQLNTLAPEIA